MHAHHDPAGQVATQPAGRTASMISIIAPVVSSQALSFSLYTVGRSSVDGLRCRPRATRVQTLRNLRSWNLDKPGTSGRFGASAHHTGGRLRRRIEVSPH